MTRSRSVSPSSQTRPWSAIIDERPRTPPLADPAESSSSSQLSPRSASRDPADRSSERRLRSAVADPSLNVPDLPIELSRDVIDLLDIDDIRKLSMINREFFQLTGQIRQDYDNALDAVPRLINLRMLSSNPHATVEPDDRDIERAPISSPRFDEFNSLLNMVNQMRHATPKAMVLVPLAGSIRYLTPGDQIVKAFHEVSISARSQPTEIHEQILRKLAGILDRLPEGKPRLDAVDRLLNTVRRFPAEYRGSVLSTLAGKLHSLDEDQPIIDVANRIIAESASLDALDRELILLQMAGKVRDLPSNQSRFDIYRAALVAAEQLPVERRNSILTLLANSVDALPEGHARSVAHGRVLYATTQISPVDRCAILTALARSIRHLAIGQPRTRAFNGILDAINHIPTMTKKAVLQPLVESIGLLDPGLPRSAALNGILHATTEIPAWVRYEILKPLAINIRDIAEGQPRIDAFNGILAAASPIPDDLKGTVLLQLALKAHALPDAVSTDAFRRVLVEAETMDLQSFPAMLEQFVKIDRRNERTLGQMLGELSELITAISNVPGVARGEVLNSLALRAPHRVLNGGHSIDAFNRMLAACDDVEYSLRASVIGKMGNWIPSLPEDQMIGAAYKLVDKVENNVIAMHKKFALNKITDQERFLSALPKDQVAGVFTAMLNAVVKLEPNEKERSLTNLALSIGLLPDAAKLDAFKGVAEATGDMAFDESALNVLIELLGQIQFIPENCREDAYSAHAIQAAKRSSNFDFYR